MASVETAFEEELRRRGVAFVRAGPGQYDLKLARGTRTVSLERLEDEVAAARSLAPVLAFVEALAPLGLPAWPEARPRIYWCLERGGLSFGDVVAEKVGERTSRILVVAEPGDRRLTWVDVAQLQAWGCALEQASEAARANLDALLAGSTLEVRQVDRLALGLVPGASAFKTACIFAPGFRRFVEPHLGWPVLVAAPHRDLVLVLADADRPLLPRIGALIRDEFRTGAYPLSTEILRVDDGEIRAIAAFPE